MKNRIILTLIVFLIFGFNNESKSQQLSVFNNNVTNPYSVNPSKAGESGSQIFLQQRNQWVGIQGSPELSLLTTEWRLGDSKSALGFNLSYDKTSVVKNTAGFVTYAHHLKLKHQQNLSFGLSIGARNNAILFDEVYVQESGDPIIFDYNQTGTTFDSNFGLTYQFKDFELQLTALQLFGNKSVFSNSYEQKSFDYDFIRHFVASAGYRFEIKEKFGITPIAQIRGVQGFDLQYDGIVKLDYNENMWAALQYNHARSYALTVGLNISSMFVVGYSAEFSSASLKTHNGGTHEILFGIRLGKPFQPEINRKEIEKVRQNTRSYDERIEFLNKENERLEKEMELQRTKIRQLEENSSALNYDEIKKMIEDLKNTPPVDKEEVLIKEERETQELMKSKAANIQFTAGGTILTPESYASLDEIIFLLKDRPNAKLNISGHTDNTGNAAKNLELSQKRADAVKKYLTEKGVDAANVVAEGKGSTVPIMDNSTPEGRTANRRVEIEVTFEK